MFTRSDLEEIADRPNGGFIPAASGYSAYADLDGKGAHLFLQGLGFTCWGHHDDVGNGIAYTACGILLSTNGHVRRDFARADYYRGGGRKWAGWRPRAGVQL